MSSEIDRLKKHLKKQVDGIWVLEGEKIRLRRKIDELVDELCCSILNDSKEDWRSKLKEIEPILSNCYDELEKLQTKETEK